VDWPVSVALAQSVSELPTGTDWSYEMKLDGHRMIMWRTGDRVRLQARSGRDVTTAWGDLGLAGHHLPSAPATWPPSSPRTASPSTPCNCHPATSGRARTASAAQPSPNLLAELPANTPIQAVSATTDRDTTLTWYNTLHNKDGVEGIVAKRTTSPYRAGRTGTSWLKIRHADTIEATVAGFTGTARKPRALAVQLPDGRVALSQRLTTALAAAVALRLVPQPGRASTKAGDACTPAGGDIVVEVVAGTTRHAVATVVRLR
jgi:hypothetical protein